MNTKVIFGILVVCLAILVGGILLASRPPAVSANYDDFAKCLSSKGAVMYGAYWCPHCQNTKKNFGDSFQYVNYVECTVDIKKCTDANITGYPTWTFSSGTRLEGEQSFSDLAKASSCTLPTPSH
jgi:hypothetical protein